MNKGLLIRIFICIFTFGLCLYSYIDMQNQVTQLRIALPALNKEIKAIQEENMRLQYEIDQFENPAHLMEVARLNEFSHLKHPLLKEVVSLEEGKALQLPSEEKESRTQVKPALTLAIGANS
jgi:hypothetical protein